MLQYSKDGTSVSAMLDTRRTKSDGKCPVKIRVTHRRTRWYYPTGKDLTPEEWSALSTTKARALVSIRKDIESSYQIVRSAVEELTTAGAFTFDALNNRLKGATSDTVNTAFRAKISAFNQQGQVGTATVYDTILKGIERFAGAHIPFDAVTVSWLVRYAAFLQSEGKKQTTIAIHLRHLRAILNEARRQGIVKEAQYPFGRGRFEIQEGEGRKMALTLEQIGQIARLLAVSLLVQRDQRRGFRAVEVSGHRKRGNLFRAAKDGTDDKNPQGDTGSSDRPDAGYYRPLGQSTLLGSFPFSDSRRVGRCDAAEVENAVFHAGGQQTNGDNRRSSRNR